MKRSFSIALLSTLIIFSSIEAFFPPAAIGAASLLFARRFTVSVVSADFLINLGKLSKERNNPLLTIKEKSEAVLTGMHTDFFDACQGVNYIAQTIFYAGQEALDNIEKKQQTKPTNPEEISLKKETQEKPVKEPKIDQ